MNDLTDNTIHDENNSKRQTSGAVIIIRILGLLIIVAGFALAIVPLVTGEIKTLSLFSYLFSGIGLIAVGYGLLQLYLWGFYLLLAADLVLIISLIFTYSTLPFFKSFFIVVCIIFIGYFILNRDLFKQSEKI